MSEGMTQVLSRLESDWDFIASFLNNPGAALEGFDLTGAERDALTARSPRALRALGLSDSQINIAASGTHSRTCTPTNPTP